jgi:hypothetical protein
MKRFLKSLLSIGIFIIAVCTSFAFKSKTTTNPEDLNCTWFLLDAIGHAFEPNYYTLFECDPAKIDDVVCPGDRDICAICVPVSEIYTAGEFEGLPKVDDNVTPSNIYTIIASFTGDYYEDNPTGDDWAIERFED